MTKRVYVNIVRCFVGIVGSLMSLLMVVDAIGLAAGFWGFIMFAMALLISYEGTDEQEYGIKGIIEIEDEDRASALSFYFSRKIQPPL